MQFSSGNQENLPAFLHEDLLSESSFFQVHPEQSSPTKLVKIELQFATCFASYPLLLFC